MNELQLVNGIASYIAANVTNPTSDYNYIGLINMVESKDDFKNIPPGLFPFIGVALDDINFVQNGSQGSNNPTINVQIVFAVRQSGATPQEDQEVFYTKVKEIRELLFQCERTTLFGMPNDILGMTVLGFSANPTFVTQVDSNRKAYSIGIYPLELYVAAV